MPYADPEEKRRNDARYKAERRALLAAKQREYYRQHRDECYARDEGWRTNHPEVVRLIRIANAANRRARRWGVPGKLYVDDLRKIDGPCAYCGADRETFDHVISMHRGGPNTIQNLVPVCHACNRRKSRWDTWPPAVLTGRETARWVD